MNTEKSFLALNSVFPRLSETFVYQQYTTWEQNDTAFQIISSNKPQADEVHPNMTSLMSNTDYLCDLPKTAILKNIFHFAIKQPRRFLCGIRTVLSLDEKLTTSCAHFVGAICIGERYSHRTNCVHSHFTYGATAIAWWLHRLYSIPYVITLHGSDVFFDDVKDLRRKLQGAKHIIGISEFNKTFIVDKYNIAPEKISVIGMGVDPVKTADIIPPSTTELRDKKPIKLLNVGRLSTQKAHTLLLQACEKLYNKGYAVDCTIVGDGELRQTLEAEITQRQLHNIVTLAGARFHQEVLDLYKDYDIFVMSSVAEGMPIVLMEAMGRGLPVIGPDISGIPELFDHGNAGTLFKTGDLESLCYAIEKCIEDTTTREAKRNFAISFISERFNSEFNAISVAKLLTQTT